VLLGVLACVLVFAWPAEAGHWAFVGPGGWGKLPYGSRFYYPPGYPLSFFSPGDWSTYCLSQPTGFYYVCGYSQPAADVAELPSRPFPPSGAFREEQTLPPASGVLLFQLPQDAEAAVDGVPVGLSGGLGIISVPKGPHRVVVRVSGAEAEYAVTVNPHGIYTVTPTAIVPTAP
jgi:hypothetical protein